MINQEGSGRGTREWSKAKLLPCSHLNKWRGQMDLEGDGMINQEGSGTSAREMEQGKNIVILSLK
jgi:hypothetical protein